MDFSLYLFVCSRYCYAARGVEYPNSHFGDVEFLDTVLYKITDNRSTWYQVLVDILAVIWLPSVLEVLPCHASLDGRLLLRPPFWTTAGRVSSWHFSN